MEAGEQNKLQHTQFQIHHEGTKGVKIHEENGRYIHA